MVAAGGSAWSCDVRASEGLRGGGGAAGAAYGLPSHAGNRQSTQAHTHQLDSPTDDTGERGQAHIHLAMLEEETQGPGGAPIS